MNEQIQNGRLMKKWAVFIKNKQQRAHIASEDNNFEVEIINRDTDELLFFIEEQKIHHPILY